MKEKIVWSAKCEVRRNTVRTHAQIKNWLSPLLGGGRGRLVNVCIVAFLCILCSLNTQAQVITADPAFPNENEEVLITFQANEGSKGLEDFTGEVYAHTGVITNESTSPSDWKYVKTNWGQNTSETKLERIDTDTYTLRIGPSIREYYGVDDNEQIQQLAFVFRSGTQVNGSWLEGKTADGGDIFYEVSEGSGTLSVRLLSPEKQPFIMEVGERVEVRAAASNAIRVDLLIDGELIAQSQGEEVSTIFEANETGSHLVVVNAYDYNGSVSDQKTLYVRPEVSVQALPNGAKTGINYLDEQSVTLVLQAPNKEHVFVLGDFSDWNVGDDYYMNRTPDGEYFWKTLKGLEKGKEYVYQYLVDGEIKVADPYARKIVDPYSDGSIEVANYPNPTPYPIGKTTDLASVLQTAQMEYAWQVEDFDRPAVGDLVIYELLVRDFTEAHSYQSLIDTLGYLERLGVNAIELMPVMEFENNDSWGYNPSFLFAVDKYYGTTNDLKRFIDAAHARGMAVIFDIVLNHHFGQSPLVRMYWDGVNNRPALDNPWFNPSPKHDFNVGYDINHESEYTIKYMRDIVQYWVKEFNIDGYRFDLSKGLTQKNTLGDVGAWGEYDQSRVDILSRIKADIQEIDSDVYLILEHLGGNVEEKALSELGFMLWGNMNHNYNEATMGYHDGQKSNLMWGYYGQKGWEDPHLISYMESHDEERLMYKNIQYGNSSGGYNIKDIPTGLARNEMAAAFYFLIPGPKMIWQFGELGYDYSIDYNGRVGRKPIKWDYYADPNRKQLYDTYSQLIALKKEFAMFKGDFTNFDYQLVNDFKYMTIEQADMSVLVFGNFDVNVKDVSINFPKSGNWYNYFTGDTIEVSETYTKDFLLAPGKFYVLTTEALAVTTPPQDQWSRSIQLYPNPTTQQFTLTLDLPTSSDLELELYDVKGQIIEQQPLGFYQLGKQQITYTHSLANGVYYIRIRGKKIDWKQRFVVVN